jgi:hypothetical protein
MPKAYIEEGQAMQWPSKKGQNDKQWRFVPF